VQMRIIGINKDIYRNIRANTIHSAAQNKNKSLKRENTPKTHDVFIKNCSNTAMLPFKGTQEKSLKLSKERYSKALEIAETEKINKNSIFNMFSKFSQKEYQRFLELQSTTDIFFALEHADKFESDNEYKNFNALINLGIDCYVSMVIIKYKNSESFNRAVEVANMGVSDNYLIKIISFKPDIYAKFLQYINEGIKEEIAVELAQLKKIQLERYEEYNNRIQDSDTSLSIAKLNDDKFKKFEECLSLDGDIYSSVDAINYPAGQIKKAIEIIRKYGIKLESALALTVLSDVDMINQAELLSRGLPSVALWSISNQGYDEKSYSRLKELLDNGVDTYEAIEAARYEKSFSIILDELAKNHNPMRDFLNSADYLSEIKKLTKGEYQAQLMKILNPSSMSYSVKQQLLESNLSREDFLDSAKKIIKSTYKHAMKTPNQYLSGIDIKYTTKIDGHYPKLDDNIMKAQQKQITEFFKENFGKMTRALKYIDTDTINQMMDKRTIIFEKLLDDLNNLKDDNFELLANLIKCQNKQTLKPLTAKDKIQLCQIVEIYQGAGLNTSILSKMAQEGVVDINEAKHLVQISVLKKAGITDEELQAAPKEKLEFNEEYAYLAITENSKNTVLKNISNSDKTLSYIKTIIATLRELDSDEFKTFISRLQNRFNKQLDKDIIDKNVYELNLKLINTYKNIDKYTDDEIIEAIIKLTQKAISLQDNTSCLYTIIREAALGNFRDFIFDKSNIYGETNAKTEAAFKKAGLDYNEWLKPHIDDVKFSTANKNFTIKLWDRNPQEDLFIGNKTSCCSAIGTGANGIYTPVFLSNTSYNVVEMYDDSGKAVGMSRVFMGNIDGKNVMCMDNIELNSIYKNGAISHKESAEIRDGFFKYINRYAQKVTKDLNTQVYFYSGDINVSSNDLEITDKVTHFIGSVSHKPVYFNAAGCIRINPEELDKMGKISWFIVPKEK